MEITPETLPRVSVEEPFLKLMADHPMPEELIDQFPAIRDLVWAMYVHGFIAGARWHKDKEPQNGNATDSNPPV